MGDEQEMSQTASVNPIPLSRRRGLFYPAFAWSGFTSAFASIIVGHRLQLGLGTPDALFAVVLGSWLLFVYSAAIGFAAGRWGLNSQLTLEAVFGRTGAILPGLLLAFLVTGWYAFHVVLTTSLLSEMATSHVSPGLWIGLVGIVFALPVVLGYSHGFNLTAVAFPAMVVFVTIVLLTDILPKWPILLDGPLDGTLSFGTGVCIAFGTFVVSGTMTGDIVRYCRTGNEAIQATVIGFLLSNFPFLVCGVLIGAVGLEPASFFTSYHPLSIVLLLLVLIAHWTTCDACLANASVTLKRAFPGLSWALLSSAAAVIGIAIAISDQVADVFNWVMFLVVVVPPIGGVILADYYVLRANGGFSRARSGHFNYAALLATAIAIATTFIAWRALPDIVSPLIGAPLAAITYLLLASIAPAMLGAGIGVERYGAEAID
ncbi:cytosine permease [Hoeflea sp. Naph1]|uniref:cytosine permease n=1 Tax=Hoeflea sp. Naph1 TaxID=3388653 RepID=UPI0039903681